MKIVKTVKLVFVTEVSIDLSDEELSELSDTYEEDDCIEYALGVLDDNQEMYQDALTKQVFFKGYVTDNG